MKINAIENPKMYSKTQVICRDDYMLNTLNGHPNLMHIMPGDWISSKRALNIDVLVHTFTFGALLYTDVSTDNFYILSTMVDGSDALSAYAELNMLENIRLAKIQFEKMNTAYGYVTDLTLRVVLCRS